MSKESDELRRLLENHRPTSSGSYPKRIREQAARYACRRRAEKATWATIAKEVGVSTTSLANWSKALPESSTFVPVVVKTPSATPLPAADSLPTLISPTGYRVEGLSLQQLAQLLGRLS